MTMTHGNPMGNCSCIRKSRQKQTAAHWRDAAWQSVLMCTTTTRFSPSVSHGASSTFPASLLVAMQTQPSGSAVELPSSRCSAKRPRAASVVCARADHSAARKARLQVLLVQPGHMAARLCGGRITAGANKYLEVMCPATAGAAPLCCPFTTKTRAAPVSPLTRSTSDRGGGDARSSLRAQSQTGLSSRT